MEALLFMVDSITILVIVYMSLRDERRDPGAPAASPFRTKDDTTEKPPVASGRKTRRSRAAARR